MFAKQPTLAELTDRLLQARQADPVHADEPEVEPYEVLNGFKTDARTAYTDATLALKLFGAKTPPALPPEWAAYANLPATCPAVPLAVGEFPQKVRDLAALIAAADLTAFRPQAAESLTGFSALRSWIHKNRTSDLKVLADGIARGLGDARTDAAAATPMERNELAADAWKAGDCDRAVQLWQQLPDSAVRSFNLGMALLFTGRSADALPHLKAAATALADTTGWSHLAELYLALAEMKK